MNSDYGLPFLKERQKMKLVFHVLLNLRASNGGHFEAIHPQTISTPLGDLDEKVFLFF